MVEKISPAAKGIDEISLPLEFARYPVMHHPNAGEGSEISALEFLNEI
jgi:hypothetical protein